MTASQAASEQTALERVTAVEEKLAYLEHSLGELDAMIYRQQQTIEGLERRCRELEQRLQGLAEKLNQEGEGDGPELPPHY
jgi:uncharacterized coiled-coil protein SlyX